jgi:glycosyltransferase involved in cell wall biosynthesis
MAGRKATVLFVLPSLKRGGAELQTLSLLRGMSPRKYEKHLLCFGGMSSQISGAAAEDVTLHCLRRKGRVDRELFRDMADLFDRLRPDIVHCVLLFSYFNAFWARRRSVARPPLVASIHTTTNRSLKDEFFERAIYRFILPKAERIVFVSSNQKEFWRKKYAFVDQRSTVVHNGVDTDHFRPDPSSPAGQGLRKSLDIPPGANVLLCVAAFRPEKGHRILLEALAGMPDSCLLLAGDGERRNEIVEAAQRLKLMERVRFLGIVDDVRPYLSIASLSVLPSVAVETFSMAMLESLAMGVPVIGSDIGGMSEAVLPGRTGWLVPPGDVKALRQAIAEGLSDHGRVEAMGKRGRTLVQDRFSRERMVRNMESVFDSMITEASRVRSGGQQ